jgi:tetratricopeptide (TPR) repeat protein
MTFAGIDPIRTIHKMEDHDTAYDVWKTSGVKARTLVHFDGHIDFNWIVDHTLNDLLRAKTPTEFNHLASRTKAWNLDQTPRREKIHIGNFIAPAIEEGMVNTFYWVLPDPFWTNLRQRRAVQKDLEALARKNPSAASRPQETATSFTMTLWDCPLTVCRLADLPRFNKAVLLDIDIDYFVTNSFEASPPYYLEAPVKPWMSLPLFWKQLRGTKLPADFITLCYSVNQGYTPLRYKYIGDNLEAALENPKPSIAGRPTPLSAAAAYEKFEKAWRMRDEAQAQRWWTQMIRRDPSYRTVYATTAYREESFRHGNLLKALRGYDRLMRLDPAWHVPFFGRGRILWRLKRWNEAEASLRAALEKSPGSTFANYWLGLCLARRGETLQARALWQKVLKEYPRNELTMQALARLETRAPSKTTSWRARPMTLSNDPSIRYERQVGIVTRKILDEVILVPVSQKISDEAALFTLDAVAAFLWDRLTAPISAPELIDALQQSYDVTPPQAATDVRAFLSQLTDIGVLRISSAEGVHAAR